MNRTRIHLASRKTATNPAPAVLEVTPTHVRVGDGYAATYAVCGFPAEVGPAWLVPLLSYPGRVTVAVHTQPVPAQIAAPMLTKQRARLEGAGLPQQGVKPVHVDRVGVHVQAIPGARGH
jgi:hypothetical protein